MSKVHAIRILTLGLLAMSAVGCSRAEDQAAGNAAAPDTASAPETPVAYASLTGDAAAGETIFIQCRACHTVEPGQNRVGPTLHGVVGRAAGAVPGYNYSPANRNSALVWTEEQLFAYLEAPQKVMPGTKMAYGGLRNPQARADLIAYLKTKS